MKQFFSLTVGLFTALVLARPSVAGPERIDSKESKIVQPVMEEPCNWTGLYIGVHAGYQFGNLTWGDDANEGEETGPQEPFVDKNQDGLFAGGQLGYNHQFGSWVIGGEGTLAYSEARTNTVTNFTETEPSIFTTHNDWTGTIALRAGYAFHHFLFYVKGGGAFVHEKYFNLHKDTQNESVDFAETFKSDEVRMGGLAGAGVEYAINCNWSAKVEYNHLFLGTDDITGTHIDSGVPEPETFVVDMDQDTVQFGLNYKFGSILGAHDGPGASYGYSSVERMDAKSSKQVVQPVMEEPCSWTGFYIGVHAGYQFGNVNWGDDANESGDSGVPETFIDESQDGLFAGGQLGYNRQFGSWVIGGEGTLAYSEARTSKVSNILDEEPNIFTTRNDWTGTIALRAGYAFHHFLFYAKGGGAFVHEKYFNLHKDEEFAETFKADEVRMGGLAGAGVEYAITCHWSAKVEYNHLFLGTDDITGTHIDAGVPEPETYVVDMDQNSVQAGLNYKF